MKIQTALFSMIGLLATISAHATIMQQSSENEITKVVYACKDKNTLDVIFVNTDKDSYAIINQVDEMIPMKNVKSASGAVYKPINPNYDYELATKGNTATLLANDKPIIEECTLE
ncbi:lysozyme inhibitor [[Haemophilus] ducreyi]|uniref:C-type lysozyme inhibitor domain-containing protein n=2 Tax=Haemophilus ducreyi TaxID=730 RepID=Q7VM08_HAEDU|nr:c-type lysozyme inhibitor [[Haemophilus] ducreyi]AAP96060.1 hypothetical protein HD_1218 [[Haemophilus] ducreyi 35000HP]AKO31044.1 lysozyme inhibitor [[Haemophilus] ducreyi]AKO32488.1 lysozyme inhibitor [[Haemophilus] ducreyi]AKO33939.1 lysozyme inhibitor [[Haemophilus] ducreyi]AKO35386.1 lysozyme inhibitor [[Haemophilus] ducreyi]